MAFLRLELCEESFGIHKSRANAFHLSRIEADEPQPEAGARVEQAAHSPPLARCRRRSEVRSCHQIAQMSAKGNRVAQVVMPVPPAPGTKDAARHSAPLPTPQAESRFSSPSNGSRRLATLGLRYSGSCPDRLTRAFVRKPPGDLERYSFELRRTAAVEVSKGAFDEAVASLGRHTGAKVGKRQVEELAGRAAEDFDAFYGQRAPPAGDRSASVLAITADGKGVVMLRKDLREATKKAAEKGSRRLGKRLTKGEKRNRKRMATVAAVYTVEPFVRQPEDVVRVLAPSDEREKDKRPRPQDKRVWASLANPRRFSKRAFAEAERRDPSHRKSWVALVDGNATQLKILHKLAGQHHVELTIVLDFIHVCEYVWKASLGFYEETEPARQVWVQERLLRILRGEACLVAAGIRRSATRRKLTPDIGRITICSITPLICTTTSASPLELTICPQPE